MKKGKFAQFGAIHEIDIWYSSENENDQKAQIEVIQKHLRTAEINNNIWGMALTSRIES